MVLVFVGDLVEASIVSQCDFILAKTIQKFIAKGVEVITLCILSDLSALHFIVLTFVHKIVTTYM